MRDIYDHTIPLNEKLRKTLISANRPKIKFLKGDLEIVSSNSEFDSLEDRLSKLEPKIQFTLKDPVLTEFTDHYNCMVELLDYRNELLGEIKAKIEDQKYALEVGDRLKKFETSKISKNNTKDYHDLLEIKRKTEALAQDLSRPNYCAYFSRDEVHAFKGSIEHIARIVEKNVRGASEGKIEKAYENFIKDNPNLPESIIQRAKKRKSISLKGDTQGVLPLLSGSDLKDGATAVKTIVADIPQSLAETRKLALENSEKAMRLKESKRLANLTSPDYRRKIALRLVDLSASFTKEAEKNGSAADSSRAEIFIKRILKTNPFWSKNNRNWVKIVDYFREVHKDSPALNLKNFIIAKSKEYNFRNVELLLPVLFLDVSEPKLELSIKPQPSSSPAKEPEASKK